MSEWVVKETARLGEMSPKLALRIEFHRDGDIAVFIDDGGCRS
jgi:hypothetical protein